MSSTVFRTYCYNFNYFINQYIEYWEYCSYSYSSSSYYSVTSLPPCMYILICGFVNLWICGFVHLWICGFVDLSIYGFDLSIDGFVDLLICQFTDLWILFVLFGTILTNFSKIFLTISLVQSSPEKVLSGAWPEDRCHLLGKSEGPQNGSLSALIKSVYMGKFA